VVGKGVIKEIKRINQLSNIVAIDYDPGASEVNQLNRIKLMLASAHKNFDNAQAKENEENFTREQTLEVFTNTAHEVNL
jgi:predicted nucleotide-binding protein (sugar kinase/HSP70/actin superfamily)